jgi:hypothetical protein
LNKTLNSSRVMIGVWSLVALTLATAVGCGVSFGEGDLGAAEPNTNLPDRKDKDEEQSSSQTDPSKTPNNGDSGVTTTTTGDAGDGGGVTAGPKKAFVSSTLVTGNIGGVAGADALCNNAAKAANLPGTYVAWISTQNSNAIDRVVANGPWQLVDGTQIAATKADLTLGNLPKQFNKDEKGNIPPAVEDRVWTGTGPNGKFNSADCNAWGGTGGGGLVGEAEQKNGGWTSIANEACTEVNRVYCLQNN